MSISWPFRRVPDPTVLAQQHTEAAVTLLAEAIGEEKFGPQNRVRAAVVLLERGWGRPRMAAEKTGGPASHLSDAELAASIEYVRERVAEQEAAKARAAAEAQAGGAAAHAPEASEAPKAEAGGADQA